MGLSSEDLFSRRVTPLGVYCPKDRMKQERQFATMVLELLHRKVYEEEEEEVDNDNEKEKEGDKEGCGQQQQQEKGQGQGQGQDGLSPDNSLPTAPTSTPPNPSNDNNNPMLPPPPPPPSLPTTTAVQEKQPERKVSIADQIKPPPAHVRPSLRLTNPDRLVAFNDVMNEDDRRDVHAPRTPANVRGNRSMLHKVRKL